MKKLISSLITLFLLLNINCQTINNFPHLCEFENNFSCNWFNIENGQDFHWLTSKENNSYVFVISLSKARKKQAWLEAEIDLRNVKKAEIVFNYKIENLVSDSEIDLKDIKPGTLQLDINHKGKWKYDLWHKHSSNSEWKKQRINLSEYCGGLVILSFTGYLEIPWSEICLDNILITAK